MKDNLIKTVQKFLVESANERTRRERLVRFLNHVTGFSGPIKAKYSSSWDHFNGLKGVSDIQSETHENGLVLALIQIAQDPLSDGKGHTVGLNLKEQIIDFLKEFYPGREKEVDRPGAKGTFGGAGVQY